MIKLAVVTEDGTTVHSHFGQAPYYEIVTIDGGQVLARERRTKPFHKWHQEHAEAHPAQGDSHAGGMADVIRDCQVVLAGGMGQPAFLTLQAAGIQPLLVQERTIDQAVQAYLRGELSNHPERIHRT